MKYHRAFLLFEVLIAILITSTALIVLLQGLGSSLRASRAVENYFKASILAEAQLALLEKEISVKIGSENGRFSEEQDPSGKFSWEQKITPVYKTGLFGTIELPICNVELVVKGGERNKEQKVKLITYLLKYEESPAER